MDNPRPAIAPPIGPRGVKDAPRRPILPMMPAVKAPAPAPIALIVSIFPPSFKDTPSVCFL